MLLKNDLLEYAGPEPKRARLLWCGVSGTLAYTIDPETALALPEPAHVETLLDDLGNGRAKLMLDDPYRILVPDDEALEESQKRIRDKAWALIQPLVEDEPAIYDAARRGRLIAALLLKRGATKRTLYRYLRRYWQRGQTPNALLPDYRNCGARGVVRNSEGAKRGRPVKFGSKPGLNITPDIRRVFKVATERFYVSNRKFELSDAYHETIKTFFSEKTVHSETGRIIHIPGNMEDTGFPTYGQYCYWVAKEFNKLDIKRKRMGPKRYDKDMRGLLGTSTAEVTGPGSRFQIDATIADIYLISRLNRHRIVGRPVIYVVVDVFSRMIVGLYIGFEGPSWVGAMMALANTAVDKVAYCKNFGISIEQADWPCHHLPGVVLGDRGEIESAKINTLANNFHVIVENAATYRADWKGIVEQMFHLLHAKFKPYVPGYIDTDFRIRGGRDYRLDAVLDLHEFTKIIIECVLHYNNHRELTKYDKDRDVKADGVPPIPIELWNWGILNRSGRLRSFPEESVRFSLLPREQATITPFGIRWRGSFYTCPRAMEERWFDHARQKKSWHVPLAYDPRDLDITYLTDGNNPLKFDVCTLTDRSRAHRGLSLWEVEQQDSADKHASADRRQDHQLAGADLTSRFEQVVEGAKQKRSGSSKESAASRTADIRGNRSVEKETNRADETFRFGQKHSTPGKTADVIPFPGTDMSESDYSEPGINEIVKPEENDDE